MLCTPGVAAALTQISVIAGVKILIPGPHPSDLEMRQTWVSTGNSQRRRQNMSTQATVFLPTPLKRVSSAFIASSSSSLRGTHTCNWCAVVKFYKLQPASSLPVDAAGLRHVLLGSCDCSATRQSCDCSATHQSCDCSATHQSPPHA